MSAKEWKEDGRVRYITRALTDDEEGRMLGMQETLEETTGEQGRFDVVRGWFTFEVLVRDRNPDAGARATDAPGGQLTRVERRTRLGPGVRRRRSAD